MHLLTCGGLKPKLQQCCKRWQIFRHWHIMIKCIFVLFKDQGRDPGIMNSGIHIPLQLVSEIECIQEQMSRDNIHFVRFEAVDLHGVSRSKSIPSRFFRVCYYVRSFKSSVSPWCTETVCYDSIISEAVLLTNMFPFIHQNYTMISVSHFPSSPKQLLLCPVEMPI